MKFNLLEINLSTQEKKVVDASQDIRQYLGGRGYGAKLLWDRVPQGADPLGKENILYIGPGPITGFFGTVTNFSAKSPLTFLRGQSNMSGHFGLELIYAGYNAGLLLTGKSPRPVYLYIENDDVEFRDAAHLWGKTILASSQILREELKKDLDDQHIRILTIGPAGEHLVRNATIAHDFYHHAARLGMGSVMGSKNLKAIAVRGNKGPDYHHPHKIYEMVRNFHRDIRLKKAQERRWGHTFSVPDRYYKTTEGVKNKQLGWDPICDLFNPLVHEQQYKLWNDGCNFCHIACKVPYYRTTPPLGPCAGEFRHDNNGGWSANAMVPGYDAQMYITPYLDDLGLDGEDVPGVITWMMECFQRGIVTKKDLDGVDLTWGNIPAICEMVRKIAFREGIGNLLAEGLKFAPSYLGRESEKYAMHSKGVAITSYEPRGSMQDAVELATCPVGSLHGGRGNPERVTYDSLTLCVFPRPEIKIVYGFENFARELLGAVCGWNVGEEEMKDMIRRVSYMERCYSIREGYLPERDDILPDRFFNETIYNKYGEPKKLEKDEFFEWRKKIYLSYELDPNGIPPKDMLKKIGMEFILPVLDKVK